MKLLFCPLSSPGFSFCAVAVARAMASRGHEICFAVDPWLIPVIRAAGLKAVTIEGAPPAFQTSHWHRQDLDHHRVYGGRGQNRRTLSALRL